MNSGIEHNKPTSLKNEISGLLKQIIIKRKFKDVPLYGNLRSASLPLEHNEKLRVEKQDENIITVGDLINPALEE
eukprot:CAMPEP_0205811886 /NCGR_PEP_ID=MMETSP0205-20121125/16167_1 /ASSEMBLY_ACC=CAM_ASM_000278 /TAXON_ID=36767 /ORGANISM="Euplotes focardii, Strain TN1" /LENGTH=74 /DNA_ID=CAMNT_0053091667 /DNA_START=269 /DNA_END=493 /DNA_ORIENTATION=-